MALADRSFLALEGIDSAITVRELVTSLKQASCIRLGVGRNMDPDNMKVILGTSILTFRFYPNNSRI